VALEVAALIVTFVYIVAFGSFVAFVARLAVLSSGVFSDVSDKRDSGAERAGRRVGQARSIRDRLNNRPRGMTHVK
jgi:hypothetical protein